MTTHCRWNRDHGLAHIRRAGVRKPLALLVAALLLSGCRGVNFQTTFHLESKNVAKVRIEGSQPIVRLENRGPGQVEVQFSSPSGAEAPDRLVLGSVTRSTRGPISLRIESLDERPAEVLLRASRASRMEIEQLPAPR